MSRLACAVGLALAVAVSPARADDFRANAPAATASHPLPVPAIREVKLPNGVRILVVERHTGLPIVAVRVVSDVGAFQAAPGVAYLAAESALHGESDLAHSFNEIGALRSVHADWDGVSIRVECLAPALDRAIELAWNTATEASFHATYVKDARDVALRAREDGHWSAVHALDEVMYPVGDPMHDGLWGSRAEAAAVTPDPLEAYFAHAFAPGHVALVVVGDTTLEAVAESARRWLGGARAAAIPLVPIPHPASDPKRGITVVDHPGATQSWIALGATGVHRASDDLPALEVLAAALDHRLDQILRQHYGYTYGFRATVSAERTRGAITVEGKVETWHTGQAVREVLTAIDQLRAVPIDDAELAVAKALRRSLDPRERETNAAGADALAVLVEKGLPNYTWQKEIAAVDRVTKDDVLRVAKAYLDPAHLPVVVVGDAKAIVPSLPDLSESATAVPAVPPVTPPMP